MKKKARMKDEAFSYFVGLVGVACHDAAKKYKKLSGNESKNLRAFADILDELAEFADDRLGNGDD